MSEEPARTEGTSPARAGEAARALMRRTRQVTRRNFPAEKKIRIVLEGIRGRLRSRSCASARGFTPRSTPFPQELRLVIWLLAQGVRTTIREEQP
jgi:hypothetical protein